MGKSVFVAYFLWLLGGWFGLHHFYLGRDRQAFVWWCLLAGYGGVGWLRDIFSIPRYVAEANFTQDYVQKLTEKMKKSPKPSFTLYRFFAQMAFGNLLAYVIYRAIPEEERPLGLDWTWLNVLIPLGSAIGAHTVGNIGRQEGPLKWAVIGAYLPYILYTTDNPRYYLSTVSAALCFRKGVKWNRRPPRRRNLCKRLLILAACSSLYLALWTSNLYFNVTITNEHGETIKFRDSVQNLLNSPMWTKFKESLGQLWEFYRAHGWHHLWDQIVKNLDPLGEQNALAVLGLPETASQQEITRRWRELSRKYHPDKVKSESEKIVAKEKFLEIQEAYEKISVIHSKRKSRSRG